MEFVPILLANSKIQWSKPTPAVRSTGQSYRGNMTLGPKDQDIKTCERQDDAMQPVCFILRNASKGKAMTETSSRHQRLQASCLSPTSIPCQPLPRWRKRPLRQRRRTSALAHRCRQTRPLQDSPDPRQSVDSLLRS